MFPSSTSVSSSSLGLPSLMAAPDMCPPWLPPLALDFSLLEFKASWEEPALGLREEITTASASREVICVGASFSSFLLIAVAWAAGVGAGYTRRDGVQVSGYGCGGGLAGVRAEEGGVEGLLSL